MARQVANDGARPMARAPEHRQRRAFAGGGQDVDKTSGDHAAASRSAAQALALGPGLSELGLSVQRRGRGGPSRWSGQRLRDGGRAGAARADVRPVAPAPARDGGGAANRAAPHDDQIASRGTRLPTGTGPFMPP